ncbi:hypothetical protein SAMN04488168_14619 [Bacillus sp. 491mf]|nr:hypothetical protein SAMN04488168_14619 [Bacillus sp. 491mf]
MNVSENTIEDAMWKPEYKEIKSVGIWTKSNSYAY